MTTDLIKELSNCISGPFVTDIFEISKWKSYKDIKLASAKVMCFSMLRNLGQIGHSNKSAPSVPFTLLS